MQREAVRIEERRGDTSASKQEHDTFAVAPLLILLSGQQIAKNLCIENAAVKCDTTTTSSTVDKL